MSDFVPHLNWSCVLNQETAPPPISPAGYLLFLARTAAAGAVAIWLWRNRGGPPVDLVPADGAHQNPEEEVPLEEEQPAPRGLQISPDPEPEIIAGEEQHRSHSVGVVVFDASRVPAAIRNLCDSWKRAPIHDGRCPSFDQLEAGAVDLIVPESMLRLEEMLAMLPQAVRLRTLRAACPRLSDILEDLSILRIDPKVFSDPCELAKESTENCVMKLKITTKLICLIWRQLDRQNQQLCEELKEECFAEVADRSVENILKDARSFSDAKWSTSHIISMCHICDTLVEILYSIQELPSNRRVIISHEVTAIFGKMMNCFGGILTATEMDRTKVDIHPATKYLIVALDFFCNRRGIQQALLDPQEYMNDLCTCWISKLMEDAETKFRIARNLSVISILVNKYFVWKKSFRIEEDLFDIFMLNNTWFVWQKRNETGISSELVKRLDSLIQEYIKCYLDKYWVPLLKYLEVEDPLRRPLRSSLDRFTRRFDRICECQRKWKVLAELKNRLRKEIKNLIEEPYRRFLDELQTDGGLARSSSWKHFRKEEKIYTVEELKGDVDAIFETLRKR